MIVSQLACDQEDCEARFPDFGVRLIEKAELRRHAQVRGGWGHTLESTDGDLCPVHAEAVKAQGTLFDIGPERPRRTTETA